MLKSGYVIRNYQPEDFKKYVKLRNEAEKMEPFGRIVSPDRLAHQMSSPNYSPEKDLFVVEKGKKIIGYTDVLPELILKKVNIDCWIYPKHRRKGLATGLINKAINRARELGVKAVQANIMEDNAAAEEVLLKMGFKFVRRFNLLRLDMEELSQEDLDKATRNCRYLAEGEQDKLTDIQNLTFSGHWGYNPNTIEEIVHQTGYSGFSPEDVALAYSGDRVIGYCWTAVSDELETDNKNHTGLINMIGTDPHYRGRGVGRKLLLAGLARLKKGGLRVAVLSVDSENRTAGNLYRSVGFEKWKSTLWYEKSLD
jgi:mycothiol synthase